MKVRIKKLEEGAIVPSYSKPGDAGLDLTAINERKLTQLTELENELFGE